MPIKWLERMYGGMKHFSSWNDGIVEIVVSARKIVALEDNLLRSNVIARDEFKEIYGTHNSKNL